MNDMRDKQFEFSKIIVRRGLGIFFVQTILTLAIVFFRVDSAAYAVGLMSATIPLYAVIFGGYFGKAGLENYQKIKNETYGQFGEEESPAAEPKQVG